MPRTLLADEVRVRWERGEIALVDVREAVEYRAGHIPGASTYPLTRLLVDATGVPEGRPIVVYCATGHRSAVAAAVLRRRGHADVAHLRGGLAAWPGPRARL